MSLALALFLFQGLASTVNCQWTFTKIADTGTPIPSTPWLFGDFGMPAATDTEVVFIGANSAYYYTNTGVYRGNGGGISVIVDAGSLGWNHDGNHYPLNGFSSASSGCSFVASASHSGFVAEAVYRWDQGGLSMVVSSFDDVPQLPGIHFDPQCLWTPDTDGSTTAFVVRGPLNGVYARGAQGLFLIANANTPISDSSAGFLGFDVSSRWNNPSVADGKVVFYATTTVGQGLYQWQDGIVSTIVDQTAGIGYPFDSLDYDGDNVVVATYNGTSSCGVWRVNGGQVSPVYYPDSLVPGFAESATDHYGGLSASNGKVAAVLHNRFSGSNWLLSNLCSRDGGLKSVVNSGDALDGKTVAWLEIGENAFLGRRIAFVARFSDGSAGIYMAFAEDIIPPTLSSPSAVSVRDPKSGVPGETVFFSVTASDDHDPSPSVVCVPPSGSFFPRGTTPVTCTATDASGNQSVCTFPVMVTPSIQKRRL